MLGNYLVICWKHLIDWVNDGDLECYFMTDKVPL